RLLPAPETRTTTRAAEVDSTGWPDGVCTVLLRGFGRVGRRRCGAGAPVGRDGAGTLPGTRRPMGECTASRPTDRGAARGQPVRTAPSRRAAAAPPRATAAAGRRRASGTAGPAGRRARPVGSRAPAPARLPRRPPPARTGTRGAGP